MDTVRSEGTNTEPRPLRSELFGLLLLTIGLCFFLALVSFSRADAQGGGNAVNLIGPVGVQIADLALRTIGLCAFFLDGVLFFCGFSLLFGRRLRPSAMESAGYALAIPAGAVFLDLMFDSERLLGHKAGGFFGELGAEIGRSLLGTVGTSILTVSILLLAITLISETNPSVLAKRSILGSYRGLRFLLLECVFGCVELFHWCVERTRSAFSRLGGWRASVEGSADAPVGDVDFELEVTAGEDASGGAEDASRGAEDPPPGEPEIAIHLSAAREASSNGLQGEAPEQAPDAVSVKIKRGATKKRSPEDVSAAQATQMRIELERRYDEGGFELPSTTLLNAPRVGTNDIDRTQLKACAGQLEQALSEFKIMGKVTGITPGPVVTMYEYEPAPGVKLSSIANLNNDLARVIRAQSVRIVAPIPGKGVVGLEVPNEDREVVFLREILEDPSFQKTKARLPLALGKDIAGHPLVTDLARMPHLLVAGSTGSGKSVAVNTMIASLLYRASPADVRMIMVDPKMLELSIYDGIPHLLIPVVTDPNKAATALRWAVDEMERRYHLLSKMKVRNILGFNREVDRLEAAAEAAPPAPVPEDGEVECSDRIEAERPRRLPHIVIIIDEFADLMMVASKDVEICVARLAQKARAAGVHLILATQRPSVDVITGLIKANFPTRISFRVFSRVDSRTVLDVQGAENLLGMGDMLFRPPGRGDLLRVHGGYVDEKEIDRVVTFLKAQGEPDYQVEILEGDGPAFEDVDEDADEMYDLAVELVTSSRKASISMVQRKLRVGYNRAARMIEMMEREGVVGVADGRGAREVIAPPPPA